MGLGVEKFQPSGISNHHSAVYRRGTLIARAEKSNDTRHAHVR
jgi:hypothetical protein